MIHLVAERDTVQLVEHRLVETFAYAVGLWALGLGARVINVLDNEVGLAFMPLRIAAVLAAAVGQHTQQLDVVLVEERQRPIIEQIRRVIPVLESYSLAQATLAAAIARIFALKLAVRLLLGLGPLSRAGGCSGRTRDAGNAAKPLCQIRGNRRFSWSKFSKRIS